MPQVIYEHGEPRWNDTDRGKTDELGEKYVPSATLSTTNRSWTDPGANPCLRGEIPVTNRLSHSTALSTTGTLHLLNILHDHHFIITNI
jgi:hypothetical protein